MINPVTTFPEDPLDDYLGEPLFLERELQPTIGRSIDAHGITVHTDGHQKRRATQTDDAGRLWTCPDEAPPGWAEP
jgi:hypothetical protein